MAVQLLTQMSMIKELQPCLPTETANHHPYVYCKTAMHSSAAMQRCLALRAVDMLLMTIQHLVSGQVRVHRMSCHFMSRIHKDSTSFWCMQPTQPVSLHK